jgi:FMN phosphatase YigB (HAD superfamily)
MSALVGVDADGVLLDTRRPAFTVASRILELMGAPDELAEQGDFERFFWGRGA